MVLSQTKVNYFNQGNAKLLTGMSHLIYWIAMHSLQKYDPNHLLKVLFSNPCSVEKTKKIETDWSCISQIRLFLSEFRSEFYNATYMSYL